MKKWIALALLTCLMLLCSAACAAGDITVAFDKKSGSMNGGFDYTLKVKTNKAPESDLTVTVEAAKMDASWDVVVPAGEKTATLTIPLDVVEESTKYELTFAASEHYTPKKVTKHTVTVRPLPKVKFYLGVNYGRVGKKMSVRVMCNNPTAVLKSNNTFELRDSDGTVLSTRKWSNPKQNITFTFDVTENMTGRRYFTVWLGDQLVSVSDGYGAISAGEKTVYSTEPELPLMAIGIDCAYAADRTDEILAILDEHDVKVTFFMTAYFMRTFTEEAQKILAAGHEIANHSWTHDHMKSMSGYEILTQIRTPTEDAERLLGVTPRLFRPPYGEYNDKVTSVARSEGMEVIMWSATAHDSSFEYTQEEVLRFATIGSDFKPGTILLMHLNGLGSDLTLSTALPYYESLGLQVVPISALLHASGKQLPERNGKEVLLYTNEYWDNWLAEHVGLTKEEAVIAEVTEVAAEVEEVQPEATEEPVEELWPGAVEEQEVPAVTEEPQPEATEEPVEELWPGAIEVEEVQPEATEEPVTEEETNNTPPERT